MKSKTSFLLNILIAITATIYFISCGNDNVVNNNSSGASYPNVQIKANSVYYFSNDSISQNGTYHHTNWRTKDSVWAQTNFNGKDCFPVYSITQDTSFIVPVTINTQMWYISYNSQNGQYYQWGVKRMFDTTQTASWDLIADFSKQLGTYTQIFTLNNVFGNPLLSANVFSSVIVDTVVVTNSIPKINVNAYRVSLKADIYAGGSLQIGTAYIDYYIGYTPSNNPGNPSGYVRFKLYPLTLQGNYSAYEGADQKILYFRIP